MQHWRHKQTLSCKEMLSWLSHIIRTFFSIHDFPASNIPYDASLVHLPVTHLLPFIRARVLWGWAHTSVWSWLPRKVCSPNECSMKSYDALSPASFLKESLTMQSTLFSNSRSSQSSLPSAGIIAKYHHTQHGYCPLAQLPEHVPHSSTSRDIGIMHCVGYQWVLWGLSLLCADFCCY